MLLYTMFTKPKQDLTVMFKLWELVRKEGLAQGLTSVELTAFGTDIGRLDKKKFKLTKGNQYTVATEIEAYPWGLRLFD